MWFLQKFRIFGGGGGGAPPPPPPLDETLDGIKNWGIQPGSLVGGLLSLLKLIVNLYPLVMIVGLCHGLFSVLIKFQK